MSRMQACFLALALIGSLTSANSGSGRAPWTDCNCDATGVVVWYNGGSGPTYSYDPGAHGLCPDCFVLSLCDNWGTITFTIPNGESIQVYKDSGHVTKLACLKPPTNNNAANVWKCDNESTHVRTCGQHITVYLEHLSGNNCTGAVQNTGEMTIGCNSCATAPQ